MLEPQVPTIAEAREHVVLLSQSLPTIIDAGSFRTKTGAICRSKAPTIALSFRETQAWRVEEFARGACDLLERGDLVAGVASARHMLESCAAVWYLLAIIETHMRTGIGHRELYDRLGRLFIGAKKLFPDMPRSINALTFVQKMDEIIPGFESQYDRLSEISHPNWAGSAAIYAKRTDDNFTTYFGREIKDHKVARNLALNSIIGGLEIFGFAYSKITDHIPEFVDACERSLD